MRVFVPYTRLRPQTFIALKHIATFVRLRTNLDYSRYFIERWKEGVTFINVEQDVVPTWAQLQKLWSCAGLWCGYSYRKGISDLTPYLGCVKISSALIKKYPRLWVERSWGNCDVFMANQLTIPYHYHGTVEHLHTKQIPIRM